MGNLLDDLMSVVCWSQHITLRVFKFNFIVNYATCKIHSTDEIPLTPRCKQARYDQETYHRRRKYQQHTHSSQGTCAMYKLLYCVISAENAVFLFFQCSIVADCRFCLKPLIVQQKHISVDLCTVNTQKTITPNKGVLFHSRHVR